MQISMQKQQAPRRLFGVFASLLITIAAVVGVFFLITIIWARAMRQKELRAKLTTFNRQKLNPLTLRIAGNRSRIYAALKHTGRRSGQEYLTPVVAAQLGGGFVIPLPYGTGVDWLKNVMAAGKCTLTWNEHEYALEKPEVIPQSEALGAFPWAQKVFFALGGIDQFLWLHPQLEVPAKTASGV